MRANGEHDGREGANEEKDEGREKRRKKEKEKEGGKGRRGEPANAERRKGDDGRAWRTLSWVLDKKRRWRVQRAESAESERKRGRGRAKGKWAGRGKSAGKAERSQSVDERARRMSCAPWSMNVEGGDGRAERVKVEKKDGQGQEGKEERKRRT